MKLWKGATFAFVLCGAALTIVLVRNMTAVQHLRARTKHSHTSSSSPRQSSESESSSQHLSSPRHRSPQAAAEAAAAATESSQHIDGLRRRVRSADQMSSLLSEFSSMFQSFTEGELQHVVGTLLDRKQRKRRRPGGKEARRTKRARRPRPCSLRELELTVSELGLGYESDETIVLRYCSGKCTAQRHNYDITMEHMMHTGFSKKGRRDKVSNGPCCRPTAFEKDFSFLDNNSRYHTVQNVSAKNCGCV